MGKNKENVKERDMETREEKKRYLGLEEMYISPFTQVRKYDGNGKPYYVPLERREHPTGIYVADYLMQCFSRGENCMKDIARRLGVSGRDLSGLLHCLTGQPSEEFRRAYRLTLVDDLLRFTSLPLPEVARLSGIGTERNLNFFVRRNHGCTPDVRRIRLRKSGDTDRFKV